MTKLYITRHGQTEWNVEGRIQGRMDSKLTELGERQARWLGERLMTEDIDIIISSSSGRALRTAELVRGERGIDIIASDQLMEMHIGDWEGQLHYDVQLHSPEEQKNLWNFPHLYKSSGGESFIQVMDRVKSEIERILLQYKDRNLLIVTHAIALKAILAHFENKEIKDFWSGTNINSACLNIIEVKEKGADIMLQGDISHYKE